MLYEFILNDIKQAMLDGNAVRRDCLRAIISEVKNQTVNAGRPVTDDACLAAVRKSVKQHRDSIANFESGGRPELAVREKTELSYIEGYLPAEMTEDEVLATLRKILETTEPVKKNFGAVMKALPSNAPKKTASRLLNGLLK